MRDQFFPSFLFLVFFSLEDVFSWGIHKKKNFRGKKIREPRRKNPGAQKRRLLSKNCEKRRILRKIYYREPKKREKTISEFPEQCSRPPAFLDYQCSRFTTAPDLPMLQAYHRPQLTNAPGLQLSWLTNAPGLPLLLI